MRNQYQARHNAVAHFPLLTDRIGEHRSVHDIILSKKKHRRLLPLSPQRPIGAPAVQESVFLAPRTPSSVWPIRCKRAGGHRLLLEGRSYAKTTNLEHAFGSRSRVDDGRSTLYFHGI